MSKKWNPSIFSVDTIDYTFVVTQTYLEVKALKHSTSIGYLKRLWSFCEYVIGYFFVFSSFGFVLSLLAVF